MSVFLEAGGWNKKEHPSASRRPDAKPHLKLLQNSKLSKLMFHEKRMIFIL